MARLIVKSPYYKCGGNTSLSGYLRYIATREWVELLPDDRPPTRKQEQLINKLTKDFPDSKTLYEYEDYATRPTKFNASAFITLALESNWDKLSNMEGYAGYIATRPRAERLGSHGLFGDEDGVDLESAMSELEQYTGNVWTHIISLKREDAVRLGYDNAEVWRDLLRAHRNDIAAAMNIPPNDFRWYAAFHDEGEHPHVHMMAWSAKPGQAYLSKEGIRQIKSELTNDIFKQELLHLYEQKSASRDELVHEARKAMLELVQVMKEGICDHPEVERLMLELAMQLETVKGKKSYGYLPRPQKKLVDRIVDEMERLPSVRDCYDQWMVLQGKVDGYYHDRERKRVPLSQQKEFRQIKNAVIKEAENIRQCKLFFEDKGVEQESEPEEFQNASYDYESLLDVIRDDSLTMEERGDAVDEMNQLAKSGDKHAQYLMGKLWRDGPLLTPDWVNARYWFQKSAEQGHTYAQYALGKLLLSDDPEVHDVEDGIRWLKRAAESGNHFAAYRLGKEYYRGKNIGRNFTTAAKWFERGAQAGNQYAQYMLGKLYLMGQGVEYSKEQGAYWLNQAAEQGNVYAEALLQHQDSGKPPHVFLAVTRLLHHMGRIFQEQSLPQSGTGLQVDSKLRQRIKEKKTAMGHKADDHEDPELTQSGMGGMTGY
ncbi:MobP3 family relaxase [Flintibacter sp. HCN-6482]|uniref:MobP3 family relaxase n=1 Tax=Flintibacter sp. HCN-6482 TaxID=3134672 RepID=UPI0030C5C4CB